MKKSFFRIFIVLFALFSCTNDDDSLQKIDQVLYVYVKDANGNDLLNPTNIGAFTSYTLNDELAETDIASVSSERLDSLSVYYLKYVAGATRQLVDGSNPDDKEYRSKISLSLTKKITDTTFAAAVVDTLEIHYRLKPEIFEISQVLYNNSAQQIVKVPYKRSIVTIIK